MQFCSPQNSLHFRSFGNNFAIICSMVASKQKRGAVIFLHNEGKSAPFISKTLGIPIRTVYDAIKRYKELGNIQDRPKSGRPVTACTSANKEKIRKRIERNPERSMRSMAKSIGIHKDSVRKIVKTMLGRHPYKITKGQFLNEKMKTNRLKKSRKMQRLAAAGRHHSILFTDEKIFTIERHHNHQNDRQLLPVGSSTSPKSKIVSRSHFPASVMVWGGICATGKTPLVFIEKGVKVSSKVYQEKILRDVLYPWAQQHFENKPWILQQDWAPAHSAKSTITLCKELFSTIWDKTIWPSNSPDLNPMDYSVWSILEKRVPTSKRTSVESLKKALQKAWDEITVEELTSIVNNFTKRLEACITAKGDHFEIFL
jgi:inhibitor of nuclear factor kappa-B kinase subunit alpha